MKTWVINLDRRIERWYYIREHLAEHDLKPIRFTAIDKNPGWVGCRQSHLEILRQSRNEDAILIFEDDAMFVNDMAIVDMAIEQLPINYDVLYLGASPQEPQERYSKNLFRLHNALCLHAYLITNNNGCIDYILNHAETIRKIDDFFAHDVQYHFNCFVCYPIVCTQRQFQSDTCKRSDVSTILTNFNKFCKSA
jgi:GR25 family glycosyltransferase involved in LPS biosynthesis